MKNLEQLKEAIHAFDTAGIDFVLIGGLAMIAHGANTLTQDVDLAYAVDFENRKRLAAFLSTIHARILGRPRNEIFVITPEILEKARFINLRTDLGEVDVMRDIAGLDSFDGLVQRAIAIDLGGFTVRVASLDDLISMKRSANRPKDQAHLYELMALKKIVEQQETS